MAEKNKSRLRQGLMLVFKFAIAGLMIWWLVRGKGEEVLHTLKTLDPKWFLFCMGVIVVQAVGTAIRWKILLPPECRTSWYDAFRLSAIGLFSNIFVPGGAVGGDVVKASFFAADSKEGNRTSAAVSILMDRLIGMASLFSITLAAGLWNMAVIPSFAPSVRWLIVFIMLVCVAGLSITVFFLFQDVILKWRFAAKMMDLANKYLKGIPGTVSQAIAAYRARWKTVLVCFLFSMIVLHPLLFAALLIPLYGDCGQIPPPSIALLSTSCGATASAIPVTQGGIGTRDLAVKSILSAIGISEGSAAAAMIVFTSAMMLFYICCGIAFFLPSGKAPDNK